MCGMTVHPFHVSLPAFLAEPTVFVSQPHRRACLKGISAPAALVDGSFGWEPCPDFGLRFEASTMSWKIFYDVNIKIETAASV